METWAESTDTLGEIIVTTRKREENLQEVPISINAITSVEIERRGIVDLKDVVQQDPSVVLDQGFAPQDVRVTIRGLSPTRGRQNAAVLQDGVDISSEAIGTAGGSLLINPRLFDVERVEVVKGPQNALYGRAAFAGAINYVTRKPGDVFEGRVGTDIGSDGQTQFSGSISGPVADGLSLGLDGMVWNNDGYYDNSLTGGEMGNVDGTSIAGTMVWKPTDTLTLTGRVENLDDSYGITPYGFLDFNTIFPIPQSAIDAGVVGDPDGPGPALPPTSVPGVTGKVPDADSLTPLMSENPRTCDPNVPVTSQNDCGDYNGTTRNITRGTLNISWDLGSTTLISLTHVASADTKQDEGDRQVSASLSPAVQEIHFYTDMNLFSQDLRWQSNGNEPFGWTVGALYWKEDVDQNDGSFTCLNYTDFPFFPNGFQPCGPSMSQIGFGGPVPLNADYWYRNTHHISAYGLVSWEFVENWTVSAEARYAYEDLNVGGPNTDNGIYDPSGNLCVIFSGGFAPPCPQIGPGTDSNGVTTYAGVNSGSVNDTYFAPKASLQWQRNDSQMYYISIAEGIKPKGISLLGGGIGAFDPNANKFNQEELWVYELGGKTEWADQRLLVNADVFFQDFKNKQVSTQVVVEVGNVQFLEPRIVNAGKAEVWGAELDMTWLATDYLTLNLDYTWLHSDYKDYEIFTTGAGTIAGAGNCTPATQAGTTGCFVNYDGNELEGAPDNSLVASVRYQRPLVGSTDWFVGSEANFQDDRYLTADNHLKYPSYWLFDFRAGITNDRWDIAAYVDNAFDDDTVKTGYETGNIPYLYGTGAFLNAGYLVLPDPRTYGLRVNYRFAN